MNDQNKFAKLSADDAQKLLNQINQVLFVAETVAHLKGLERDILPATDALRETLNKL